MKKEETHETFECACGDRDHMIIADRFSWWLNNEVPLEEIYLTFRLTWGEWTAAHNPNWFQRMWWRIKKASRIIFHGYVEVEDTWEPARTDNDQFDGEKELWRLINWLQSSLLQSRKRLDDIRKNQTTMKDEIKSS